MGSVWTLNFHPVNTSIAVEVKTTLPAGDAEQITRGLVGYNAQEAPPADHRPLAVVARRAGELVGGLVGHTHWGWLFVRQLWTAEEARGKGLGRRLMLAAEAEARARGCQHAHLDTFSFQALGFYARLGYRVFGQLEDYPAGHTRYFLEKRELSASSLGLGQANSRSSRPTSSFDSASRDFG